jgi:hypothetical protein
MRLSRHRRLARRRESLDDADTTRAAGVKLREAHDGTAGKFFGRLCGIRCGSVVRRLLRVETSLDGGESLGKSAQLTLMGTLGAFSVRSDWQSSAVYGDSPALHDRVRHGGDAARRTQGGF